MPHAAHPAEQASFSAFVDADIEQARRLVGHDFPTRLAEHFTQA